MDKDKIILDLKKAIEEFDHAITGDINSDLEKAGCIQYFEFTFELAWKAIKVIAQEEGIDTCNSPKSCLKYAFSTKMIDKEDVWLNMLNSRNKMSHTYDATEALVVYDALLSYLPEFYVLLSGLKSV